MPSSPKFTSILIAVWLLLCLGGFWVLLEYSNTPGDVGKPNAGWVIPAGLEVETEKATLVLFAHPRCPCTRATMSELERLQGDYKDAYSMLVVFYEPIGGGDEWRSTDLWRRARAMENTVAIADPGGVLAMDAGATTSGQLMLMNADGGMEFWGGITASRGHEGESLGGIALRDLFRGLDTAHRRTSVFGCPLSADDGGLECIVEEACCELTGD